MVIKEKGAPDKRTKGSVGDTYIDLESGKIYICTYVYTDSFSDSEYDWEFESEKIPGVDFQKNNSESDEATEEIRTSGYIEVIEEPEKAKDVNRPKYNNYRKQYKHTKN